MEPLAPGAEAPAVPSLDRTGPGAVLFYKVTCPTCQIASPAMEKLHALAGSRLAAVVQDPPERAAEYATTYGVTFESLPDDEPYPISDAYGVRTVPTLFVLDGDRVADVAEGWDREAWNSAAGTFAALAGLPATSVSAEGDGLPPWKPG